MNEIPFLQNDGCCLAAQTEGDPGGGCDIYQTVFNVDRDEDSYGKCNAESLSKALRQIGYMGDGSEAVVKDLDEFLTDFNLATVIQTESGP